MKGESMYYTIYKITNTINNKIYIGAHATKNLLDDYMGSGTVLARAKEKYGIVSFAKEILHIFEDEKSMYAKEKEIVTEYFCNQQDNYNVRIGGYGGFNYINAHPEKYSAARSARSKLLAAREDNPFKNPEWQKKHNSMNNPEIVRSLCERANSPMAIAKRKATFKKTKHQQGAKNSQFGRYWISNHITKEVKRITATVVIPEGWVKGKKGFNPKKCWVNDGKEEHFVLLNKAQEYILNGYTSGRLKTSMPQNRIVV